MPFAKSDFLLREDVTFLNHGSFGACPKTVFEEYLFWQRELEYQPVEFIGRKLQGLLKTAREGLASYLVCDHNDLVFVPNATQGVNIIARSLRFDAGSEIITTNHEYGACDRTFEFILQNQDVKYTHVPINLPVTSPLEIVENIFSQVTEKTKMIFISHITSPTALIFPVKEICHKAREMGILTLIDGAHAPGQLSLNLTEIDPDFYTGNLHKWLNAPKGAAFLYVKKDKQDLVEPLIVSWGYKAIKPSQSRFIDEQEFQGTRDFSPYLAVQRAINFQLENNWQGVISDCRKLVEYAREGMKDILCGEFISPNSEEWFLQLAAVMLPANIDGERLQGFLYEQHKVEIPITLWNSKQLIRVSIQCYNTTEDVEKLFFGLKDYVSKNR